MPTSPLKSKPSRGPRRPAPRPAATGHLTACSRSSRRCDYADNPSPLTAKTTDSGSRRRIIGTAALCS